MKCRRGPSRKRADAGHRIAGKLRQRLAAEARAAGAEEHDVGRAGAQPRRGSADGGEVVALGRQPQQRQAAVGVARAQPVERLGAARQRVVESGRRNAVRADALCARVLDRLANGHRRLAVAGLYRLTGAAQRTHWQSVTRT